MSGRTLARARFGSAVPPQRCATRWRKDGRHCPSFMTCVVVALRHMLDLIELRTTLKRHEAYMLCSLAADLRITQVVNDHKGVHVMLEKRYLQPAR